MKTKILALFLSLFFAGCEPEVPAPTVAVSVQSPQLESTRISVVLICEFQDSLAYGGKRRIYEITDNKNKQTYLAITGTSLDKLRADEDAEEAAEAAIDAVEALSFE